MACVFQWVPIDVRMVGETLCSAHQNPFVTLRHTVTRKPFLVRCRGPSGTIPQHITAARVVPRQRGLFLMFLTSSFIVVASRGIGLGMQWYAMVCLRRDITIVTWCHCQGELIARVRAASRLRLPKAPAVAVPGVRRPVRNSLSCSQYQSANVFPLHCCSHGLLGFFL